MRSAATHLVQAGDAPPPPAAAGTARATPDAEQQQGVDGEQRQQHEGQQQLAAAAGEAGGAPPPAVALQPLEPLPTPVPDNTYMSREARHMERERTGELSARCDAQHLLAAARRAR